MRFEVITFVIVIQSDDIIDLFKDFAAMGVIAELDNIAFSLANHGYFGSELKKDSDASKKVKVKDHVPKICFGLSLRPLVLVTLLTVMMSIFFGLIVVRQNNLEFFKEKYPNCYIKDHNKILQFNDGKCDGGAQNTFQCGFDGGDCASFNVAYPNCGSLKAHQVGDGICQEEHNNKNCGFDGGDCCNSKLDSDEYLGGIKTSAFLGDNHCNAGHHNTVHCAYDSGDCDMLRAKYPLCPDFTDVNNTLRSDGTLAVLGDGICDFIPQYMIEKCGYEYGDCENCKVDDPFKLGDGFCDGGAYNTQACGFDNGDCLQCNEEVSDFTKVGDGFCDGGEYYIEACNFDASDCNDCAANGKLLIGNGICDGKDYMTPECSNDGGDCDQCLVSDNSKVGDGFCNSIEFNSKECGFDGGDCLACNALVGSDSTYKIGDGFCDDGKFNSAECDWDGGDCNCFDRAFAHECDSSTISDCSAVCDFYPMMVSFKFLLLCSR